MAESGKILTMKMWTGYQYKYVLITGMTITKQPGEREVFRGTIQVQEMPILTMTVPRVKKTASVNLDLAPRSAAGMAAKLSLKAQMAVIEPLVQMLGVREASGETASALDAAKTAMGL
jgi:hypothetical protein